MTTVTLPIPIPDRLFEQLGLASQDQVPLELRFILTAKLFSDGRLSTGRAAEMAGMGKIAFMEELGRRHIPVVNWDEEEIRRELGNV